MISLNTKTVYKQNPFVNQLFHPFVANAHCAVLGTSHTMVTGKRVEKLRDNVGYNKINITFLRE